MPDWLVKLLEQWAVVTAAPIPFAIAVVIVGAVIWFAIGWSYSGVLNSKNAQIELQDRQLADYRDKLGGATPTEAKARIDALEKRLASIEPRRLSDAQRSTLIANLRLASGTSYSIAIVSEASGDSPQFAADLSGAFRAAGNWRISEPSVMGLGNRPPLGIALQFANLNQTPPEATIVMNALRLSNIKFDVQQTAVSPGTNIALLICTKIDR